MNYKTPTGRINNGVATTWLAVKKPLSEQPPHQVPIFIRKSQFRSLISIYWLGNQLSQLSLIVSFSDYQPALKHQSSWSVLVLEWPLSVDSFKSALRWRMKVIYLYHNLSTTCFNFNLLTIGKPVGDTVLFFGCRNRVDDFLYEEEFQEAINEGLLTVKLPFKSLNMNTYLNLFSFKIVAHGVFSWNGKESLRDTFDQRARRVHLAYSRSRERSYLRVRVSHYHLCLLIW